MARSVFAVVAGYVLAALGIGALRGTTVILLRLFATDAGYWTILIYLLLKLIYTLVSAIAGGYLAAIVAERKPKWHAFGVSTVLAGSFLISRSRYAAQPAWYFKLLWVLAVIGPMIGGYLDRWPIDRSVALEFRIYRGAKALVGCFLIGATIANHLSPSSDLFLPSNAASGHGMLIVEVVAFALGAWLVYSGFGRDQQSG